MLYFIIRKLFTISKYANLPLSIFHYFSDHHYFRSNRSGKETEIRSIEYSGGLIKNKPKPSFFINVHVINSVHRNRVGLTGNMAKGQEAISIITLKTILCGQP